MESSIAHSTVAKKYKMFIGEVEYLSSVHFLTHWEQSQFLTFIKILALKLPKKKKKKIFGLNIPTQNGELGEGKKMFSATLYMLWNPPEIYETEVQFQFWIRMKSLGGFVKSYDSAC